MAKNGASGALIGCEGSGISTAMAIIHSNMRNTAVDRELRPVTRGVRVSDSVKADVVISTVGGACAFQLHVNFSHGHVTDAVARAEQLAASFERCYVLLVRPNTDALQNFQLQLSPSCDARPLLVTLESEIVPEIQRVAQGVLNPASRVKRREYYKQVHHGLRSDEPHRGILGELLRGLGVREWKKEADLLLDTFGSIRYWGLGEQTRTEDICDSSSMVTRGVCLQPLSGLLANCPIAGDTARLVHAFFNEKPVPPLPCTMCPGRREAAGCCQSNTFFLTQRQPGDT